MAIDLTNRVCLVTGAARGIGKAVAEGFARRGALVVATSLEPPDCVGAAANLAWDVTDPKRADAVVKEVISRFGRIDVLVANAGFDPMCDWHDLSEDKWREIMAINLDGAWFGAQAAARAMESRGYGKIVLVSSITTETGGAGDRPHYVTAKAALIGLGRTLARSLGRHGIRVNVLMPGAIRTERELELFPDQQSLSRFVDEKQCLPGRIDAKDVEPAFAFLSCAESDAITGQVICVDHGWVHY